MKKKHKALALIAMVAVIAIMACVFVANRPGTTTGEKIITVTVVHKDGSEVMFTYDTNEEYLGPVLIGQGLVEGEEGPYGLVISAVDGETADWNVDNGYWALYVGEEYATTGADTTPVHNGDAFKLVYTIG